MAISARHWYCTIHELCQELELLTERNQTKYTTVQMAISVRHWYCIFVESARNCLLVEITISTKLYKWRFLPGTDIVPLRNLPGIGTVYWYKTPQVHNRTNGDFCQALILYNCEICQESELLIARNHHKYTIVQMAISARHWYCTNVKSARNWNCLLVEITISTQLYKWRFLSGTGIVQINIVLCTMNYSLVKIVVGMEIAASNGVLYKLQYCALVNIITSTQLWKW